MVREGKSNRACSKGLSERLKEDRISELPDALICHILSHLHTSEAVKTSVLSTRWRSMWLSVPSLDLETWQFPDINAMVSFGDRFFDSSRVSHMNKVRLTLGCERSGDEYASCLTSWIDAAIKRKIQHLYSCGSRQTFHKMPQRLYNCETLVCLKLFRVTLDDAELVCLPCLKTMSLQYIDLPNEATFEKLVLGCPVLEDLKVDVRGRDAKAFRVHSRSLKRLSFDRGFPTRFDSAGVVINAPGLSFLYINDKASKSFIVDNLDSKAKLDISLSFGRGYDEASVSSKRSSIRSFLPGVSMVRDMTISGDTLELICLYSKLEPVPRFGYLSCLRIKLLVPHFKWVPTFLEICPNLKSLILVCNNYSGYDLNINQTRRFSLVPECLLSSLESVNFIGYVHYAVVAKLIKYFLENSAILKKLTLTRAASHSTTNIDIFKIFKNAPRRSSKCEIVVIE